MVHYEPIKVTINTLGLLKVIINIVVRYHSLPGSIVINRSPLFASKFWSSLCYFFGIKRKLSTTFYHQTNDKIKWQNSTIEVFFWALVNFKQNDWAKLLPIAEFAYNNTKNTSTGYTPFKLNYGYYLCVFFKKDTNPRSQSKTVDRLLAKLQKVITIYQKNLYYTQKLQKQAQNKSVKAKSYAPGHKVWLNSK